MIARCDTCTNTNSPAAKFQDERYGANMRVHTECKGGEDGRCTVCGTKRTLKKEKAK
jgi:hypothetical protein